LKIAPAVAKVPSVSACRRIATFSTAAACLLVASGCGQPTRGDLHEAAQSLVPQGAAVLLKKDGGCVEGARFPSCVQIFFRLGRRPFAERLNLFVANARRHGWRAKRGATVGGEVVIKLSKGSYYGVAGFRLDRYYRPTRPCKSPSAIEACTDSLQVQWKDSRIIKAYGRDEHRTARN
jgi:hypothetical protein